MTTDLRLQQVYTCSVGEQHRAHNLAEYLRLCSLEPQVLPGDGPATLVVAVPEDQHRRAADITKTFFQDYEAHVDELVASASRTSKAGSSTLVWALLLPTIAGIVWLTHAYRSQGPVDPVEAVAAVLSALAGLAAFIWLRSALGRGAA